MLSHFSCVQLRVTLWTIACQAPLTIGVYTQEYWSGLPCPLPRDLRDSETEPEPLTSPALAGRFFTTSTTGKPFAWIMDYVWILCGLPCSSDGEESAKTWVESLGGEDVLEKGMAAHSSVLAWRTPWAEEPGGQQSMGTESWARLSH